MSEVAQTETVEQAGETTYEVGRRTNGASPVFRMPGNAVVGVFPLHADAREYAEFMQAHTIPRPVSPLPWRNGKECGAIVCDDVTPRGSPESDDFYGGGLVLESCQPTDRRFILACIRYAQQQGAMKWQQ